MSELRDLGGYSIQTTAIAYYDDLQRQSITLVSAAQDISQHYTGCGICPETRRQDRSEQRAGCRHHLQDHAAAEAKAGTAQ